MSPVTTAHAATTTITIDGTKPGRTFDGIGALSAGANSRLLFDYPEPQRTQILDYLFKPGYGAALQILKVEVGGDTNSTDGAEPSHKHTADDPGNYDRGYEWWLMKEAKRRNPNIHFSALAWGAPGWIGVNDPNNPTPGQPYFWSQDMIDYYIDWIEHAKSDHDITISTIGGWNERAWNKDWYKRFHAALRANGLATKIVAADDIGFKPDSIGWQVAEAMAADPAFAASVDIIGTHYGCGFPAGPSCVVTQTALNSGKTLWASESGAQDIEAGGPVARAINRGYIDARTTAYINWPPVASIYPNLVYARAGLMVANQPWAGSYELGSSLWATAHTTQFTAPGWRYIDSASGYLDGAGVGGDPHSGSYVTLAAPNGTDYSTIFETVSAGVAQTVDVRLAGGLSTGTVRVWSSDLKTDSYFVRQADITPSSGTFSLTLQPGRLYSITTTSGQGRGTAVGNDRAPMPLPYADSFEGYAVGKQARYLADMQGAFETVQCAGRAGTCVRQMAPTKPVVWNHDSPPYALLGDDAWSDYTIESDVLFEQPGSVELLARVGKVENDQTEFQGYRLSVGSGGTWSIVRNDGNYGRTALRSGTIVAPGTGTWHRLALTVQGSTLTAAVDGVTLGSVNDSTNLNGQVGIGTGGYQTVQFDNLSIRPGRIPQASMSVRFVDSVNAASPASNLLDGNPATIWHTEWAGSSPPPPHQVQLDLGRTYAVTDLSYLPRQDQANGRIAGYQVYVSPDPNSWGFPVASGTFVNSSAEQNVRFAAKTGRYVRLVATSEVNGNPWTSISEVNVSGAVAPVRIPQSSMSVQSVDSVDPANPASNLLDGNPATIWHTQWAGGSTPPPHQVQLDLGRPYAVSHLYYRPRQDQTNGRIAGYQLYVSTDGTNWGAAVATGTFANTAAEQDVAFPAKTGRYLRLVATSEVNGNPWSSVAELEVAGIVPPVRLPQSSISVRSVDSVEGGSPAANVLDGNPATFWHTEYVSAAPPPPHEIQLDLGTVRSVSQVSYLARQDSTNGRIARFRVFVSTDGSNWGAPVATDTFGDGRSEQVVQFSAKTGRYVRLVALTAVNQGPYTTIAELNVAG